MLVTEVDDDLLQVARSVHELLWVYGESNGNNLGLVTPSWRFGGPKKRE